MAYLVVHPQKHHFYLVHRPIMYALKAERFGAGSEVGYLVKMALIVALITVVAIMCHFLVERPAQRFLNRLLRIKNRPAGPVPVQAGLVEAVVESRSLAFEQRVGRCLLPADHPTHRRA